MRLSKITIVALFLSVGAFATAPKVISHTRIELSHLSIISIAQADESPLPVISPSPDAPSAGEKIGASLGSFADSIPLSGPIVAILLFAYDLVRRIFPTANPASLWKDLKKIGAGLKAILMGAVQIIDKIDGLLDVIQNSGSPS